jgi:hypothetical protein
LSSAPSTDPVGVPADKPWLNDPVVTLIKIDGVGNIEVLSPFEKMSHAEQQSTVDDIVAANWRSQFAIPLAIYLAISIAIAFGVYIFVRAIGWVIGGFAA